MYILIIARGGKLETLSLLPLPEGKHMVEGNDMFELGGKLPPQEGLSVAGTEGGNVVMPLFIWNFSVCLSRDQLEVSLSSPSHHSSQVYVSFNPAGKNSAPPPLSPHNPSPTVAVCDCNLASENSWKTHSLDLPLSHLV